MLAFRIVTDVEILDCTGRTQSPYEARSAPVVGCNPLCDLGSPKYYVLRPWFAVRSFHNFPEKRNGYAG